MSRCFLNCVLFKRILTFETNLKYLRPNDHFYPQTYSQIRHFAAKKELVRLGEFQNVDQKNKDTYLEMVRIYKNKEIQRRGHVEFIYKALKHMKEFGVDKDLEVYKSLIDVLPKGKMVARNLIQAEFMHYPKQQQCAIDVLEQMEENGVIPDWDMEDQLINVFGRRGYPLRRYWRMMYWMPKFKNISPWPLPLVMTNDVYQLALIAIQRIMSVDVNAQVTTHETSELEDSLDKTWIVSGQSPDQKILLEELSDNTPLYVDGRFRIWLRDKAVTYFTLKADISTIQKPVDDNAYDDVSKLNIPLFSKPESLPEKAKTVHEQEDGMILAVCSTGTSSRDSLLSWVRILQKTNPKMGHLPIVFKLKAPQEEGLTVKKDEELKKIDDSVPNEEKKV